MAATISAILAAIGEAAAGAGSAAAAGAGAVGSGALGALGSAATGLGATGLGSALGSAAAGLGSGAGAGAAAGTLGAGTTALETALAGGAGAAGPGTAGLGALAAPTASAVSPGLAGLGGAAGGGGMPAIGAGMANMVNKSAAMSDALLSHPTSTLMKGLLGKNANVPGVDMVDKLLSPMGMMGGSPKPQAPSVGRGPGNLQPQAAMVKSQFTIGPDGTLQYTGGA